MPAAQLPFVNAFAVAQVLARLGLAQEDALEQFEQIITQRGFRYCALALELLLALPTREEMSPTPVPDDEIMRVGDDALRAIPEESKSARAFPGALDLAEPAPATPASGVTLHFEDVPGEPIAEEE